MKALVEHALKNDHDAVVRSAIRNCHCRGVDSIVLQQDNGKVAVRLFVAHPHHELWRNDPSNNHPLSVGFHPHHCDVSLYVVRGALANIIATRIIHSDCIEEIQTVRYRHYSAIKNRTRPHFQMEEGERLGIEEVDRMGPGRSTWMKAHRIHTVAVDRGQVCAWFVFEGKEDPHYDAYCWSDNEKLIAKPPKDLYQTMDREEVRSTLALAGLL